MTVSKNMEGMAEMTTLRSFTDNEKMLMKKALYYDFMLFNRNQKPFNAFLVKSKLRNTMYTSRKNVNGSTDPHSTMRAIYRYDVELHGDLSVPNHFNPIDNVNLEFILESFKNPELDQSIFNPNTSEQIDQGIKTLATNLADGAPLYNCSTDEVMRAIMMGRFDEFLSDQNKEDMMRICYSGADPVIEGEEKIELPQRMKPTATGAIGTDFGGKNKRNKSKSKSKLKKTKRGKSKSKSKSKLKKTKCGKSKSKSKSKSKNGGGAPASYVGSIQGEFINNKGQQLFRNPVGGIS